MYSILLISIISIIVYILLYTFIKQILKRNISKQENLKLAQKQLFKAISLPFGALYLKLVLPLLPLSPFWNNFLQTTTALLIISGLCLFILLLINCIKIVILEKYDVSAEDNLKARKIHTQVKVIQRIISVLVIFIAIASMLMYFDRIRQLGASLLASAGVIGIILGFAAQKSIATIFAGLQIAITQPIRIDDVVIVEGEWGWIEEITLTYVVVRIWDLRRLVVPITCFIDKPFQNWTRTSADLLNTVFIYCDYKAPVEKIREKLKEILDSTPLWDKKAWCLQVTNAREQTLELRALMSSANSSKGWDLRCLVREQLVTFLAEECSENLPLIRLDKK